MKDKTTAWLLALFLWWLWVHKFYLWNIVAWFIYLLFCRTFIPAIVGVLEAISIFTHTDERWKNKYNWWKNTSWRDKYDELLRLHELKTKKIITTKQYNKMKEDIEKEK